MYMYPFCVYLDFEDYINKNRVAFQRLCKTLISMSILITSLHLVKFFFARLMFPVLDYRIEQVLSRQI